MNWFEPIALDGPDLIEWLTLSRVDGGRVAKHGDSWYDFGRRVPEYVAAALDTIHRAGLIEVGEPDPWGLPRVTLTANGRTRFIELNAKRADRLGLSPIRDVDRRDGGTGEPSSLHDLSQTPAGRRLSRGRRSPTAAPRSR
ncbi:MAG: hypothetical protein ACRDTE_16465 [Pseudonocardiaceae bacterium]